MMNRIMSSTNREPQFGDRPADVPHRPASAPDFALSHHTWSVRTQGARDTFSDPQQAARALATGAAEYVVGALPFDARQPWALTVPETVHAGPGPLEPPAFYRNRQLPSFALLVADPGLDQHRQRVADALAAVRAGVLDKVVLARREFYGAAEAFDPRTVAAKLMAHTADGDGFLVDLSPAGAGFSGHYLVGSSPELLVHKVGSSVRSFPLAGSAPRGTDEVADGIIGKQLRSSTKDQREHRFVVDHIVQVLRDHGASVRVPDEPQLVPTRELWHLGTPITAQLDDPAITALDLARAIHPTPAIAGTPPRKAVDYIVSHEENRRFYAGAVGWCRHNGDGMFVVSIRCGETEPNGKSLVMWAGGGIVAQSDPKVELHETEVKMRTMRRIIGVADN